jgi:uncharacterized membrane protein YraQ (UPF0718 family)
MRHPNPTRRLAWHAILWSQWAYWCQVAIAAWAHHFLPAGGVRTALVLAPTLSAVLVFAVTRWLYLASDEYFRARVLQAATTTAALLAFLATVYCFVELLGYPRLSLLWPLLVGWGIFGAQMLPLVFARR